MVKNKNKVKVKKVRKDMKVKKRSKNLKNLLIHLLFFLN